MAEEKEARKMSGDTVIWIAGLICTALYLYALTLPPDKPKRHCRESKSSPGRG